MESGRIIRGLVSAEKHEPFLVYSFFSNRLKGFHPPEIQKVPEGSTGGFRVRNHTTRYPVQGTYYRVLSG